MKAGVLLLIVALASKTEHFFTLFSVERLFPVRPAGNSVVYYIPSGPSALREENPAADGLAGVSELGFETGEDGGAVLHCDVHGAGAGSAGVGDVGGVEIAAFN